MIVRKIRLSNIEGVQLEEWGREDNDGEPGSPSVSIIRDYRRKRYIILLT